MELNVFGYNLSLKWINEFWESEYKTIAGGMIVQSCEYFDRLQIGGIVHSGGEMEGLQIGLICMAYEGRYGQLGILTFRPGMKGLKKVSPLFGFSLDRNEADLTERV